MDRARQRAVPARIEDHGVIGNLATVALVAIDGAIDFVCCPNFDSPTIFAALLDADRGGVFSIAPHCETLRLKQLYIPDTNVLMTRFFTRDAIGEVVDFMPLPEEGRLASFRIVRQLRVIKGEMRFRLRCAPRFDYGRIGHRLEIDGARARFAPEDGATPLCLTVSGGIQRSGDDAECELVLCAGDTHNIILEAKGDDQAEGATDADLGLAFTSAYWRNWAERSTYSGRWREIVTRSALTLKLLMSKEYGSIVAAATFGLPEVPGGERNWDYRYTWIRDAGFTVYAFMHLGYIEEASAFVDWVEARCTQMQGDGSLQIMYGIDGRTDLHEVELSHLRGHAEAQPVRIGNNAFKQVQLDIYGALLDSIYAANKYGSPPSIEAWRKLCTTVDYVCKNWHKPDGGIWEFSGSKSHFLYSQLMCWVAVDRAHRLAIERGLPAPLQVWAKVRDDIYANIIDKFWDADQSAFVQAQGSKALDSSTLLMLNMHFIAPRDPRWLSTLKAIGEQLVEGPFVYRYRSDQVPQDKLEGTEGSFAACSFWYVEALARSGDLVKARLVFEGLLASANHLGLYAEEFDVAGEQLGNFPQALTHLTLIMAAITLDRKLSGEQPKGWPR